MLQLAELRNRKKIGATSPLQARSVLAWTLVILYDVKIPSRTGLNGYFQLNSRRLIRSVSRCPVDFFKYLNYISQLSCPREP